MDAPRFEDRGSFLVAGSVGHYKMPDASGIPHQWTEFAKHLGKIPGQMGWTTYGVCFNMDGSGKMDYMCAVEVADNSPVPEGLTHLKDCAAAIRGLLASRAYYEDQRRMDGNLRGMAALVREKAGRCAAARNL